MKNSKINTEGRGAEGIYRNLEVQFNKVYKQTVLATNGKVSIKTYSRYRDSMKEIMSYCAEKFRLEKLSKIGDKHILAYIEHRRALGISEKTIKSDLSALRFFNRHMEGRNRLIDNKRAGLEYTPDGRKDRAWRDSEYDKFVRIADRLGRREVSLALRLSRNLGLRIHEVTRIERGQAETAIERGTLSIKGKGGKIREVPLSKEAIDTLKEACRFAPPKKDSKLLVPPDKKTHLVIKSIQNFVRNHRDKVFEKDNREKITFHGLRHSYAREQYEKRERNWVYQGKRYSFDRKAMREVSELLGHGRREVTRIYLAR